MNETATAPQLSVHQLSLARGPKRLFADLNWQLHSGQAMILRGANGSGKTSLLRVLAGLTAADAGEVRWCNQRWSPLCRAQRVSSLYLGHANALKAELSADENLLDALAFDGIEPDVAARANALDAAGLAGRHQLPARRLSQGQQRRVGLARLALSRKPLWLLDEPTNALDAEGVAIFSALLDAHLRGGGLACVATHLPLTVSANMRELALGEN